MRHRHTTLRSNVTRVTVTEVAVGLLLTLGACTALAAPNEADAQGFFDPDTIGVRYELGATSDVTNELFYEDAFIDTTFLGRNQVSTPEARIAGVFFTGLAGTRGMRRAKYNLQNELRLGDKLQRNNTQFNWTDDISPDWRLSFNPRFEFKRDQTFDRDLTEYRGHAGARLRRAFHDGATYGDIRGHAEFLRTSGDGADFIPDRNAFKASTSLEHLSLFGHEWRLGYGGTARIFPDSTVRDHYEHGFEGGWKYSFASGNSFSIEGDAHRRVTLNTAPTSRDNFWDEWINSEFALRANEKWSIQTRVQFEGFQYDVQDTSIYFNYYVVRGRTGPRFDRGLPWTFGIGPEFEVLTSSLNPAEQYREYGGYLEVEYLGRGGWWSLTPSAGWRAYDQEAGGLDPLAIHNSYGFYELSLIGDQALPGGIRMRAIASGRQDFHEDSINDATSLYFSLDVRRQF